MNSNFYFGNPASNRTKSFDTFQQTLPESYSNHSVPSTPKKRNRTLFGINRSTSLHNLKQSRLEEHFFTKVRHSSISGTSAFSTASCSSASTITARSPYARLSKTRIGHTINKFLKRFRSSDSIEEIDVNHSTNRQEFGKNAKTRGTTITASTKRISSSMPSTYDFEEHPSNDIFFAPSSDLPQYSGMPQSMKQKHLRNRIVTFDVEKDPFAAKTPMRLISGKQSFHHERTFEVSLNI